jgi:pSer/pThr/pTyr-binding forkhead associated (FHA) protein
MHLGNGDKLRRVLPGDRVTIGRSVTSDIVIPDPTVSRRHAVISCRDGGYFIEDACSRYGLFVNGRRITEAVAVSAADIITLGSCWLTLAPGHSED